MDVPSLLLGSGKGGPYLIISQRVIVQEQSGRNIEGDKYVDRVMLVSGQYEEDAKHIQQPGHCVQEVQMSRSIWIEGTNIIAKCPLKSYPGDLHSVMKKFNMVSATVCPLNM